MCVVTGELMHFIVVFRFLCHLCIEDKEDTGCLGRVMTGIWSEIKSASLLMETRWDQIRMLYSRRGFFAIVIAHTVLYCDSGICFIFILFLLQYLEIEVKNPRTHIQNEKALYTDYEIELKVR